MRISTSMLYQQAITSIDTQQTSLAKIQSQMSSGLRVQVASDDPMAAGQVLSSQKALSDISQWQSNATALQNHLGLEDNALSTVNQALSQLQSLALQANNSTLNNSDRKSLAAAMQQQLNAILAQANSQDENGRYLFGGTQDGGAPFALQQPTGVVYSGNSTTKMLPVGPSREIAVNDPGDSTFLSTRSGDGQVVVSAGSTNTGTSYVTDLHVSDPSLATGHAYSVSFNGGQYQVTDNNTTTVVASGTYAPDTAIQFDGVSLTLTGAPENGDTYQVGPSAPQDIFTTVQNLINMVAAGSGSTPAVRAVQQTGMYGALQALQGAQNHISQVLGGVGAREQALSDASTQLTATSAQLQTTISGLQDLDYAAATTKFSQAQLALQAGEQTYAAIQGLSLFNYLK
jgi:flagellar hook-associated protein 3 FlgL